MNKTYRLVWNELSRTWVAVAEHVKARGKRASGAVILVAAGIVAALPTTSFAQSPPAANQLPTGSQVVAGQAGITQSGAAMTVNQSTLRTAIDWQTYNIGKDASVHYQQPAGGVALNRINDANPSQIFGRLTATGQVYLSNPNGVYFAPSASVDVGGLVATTHRISLDDFMAGKAVFERNGATGSIINAGELKAALGGYIALLAPEVRNQGVIIANLGTVALAAGETFELQFDANNTLAGLRVTPSTIKSLVENKTAVLAPGGLIILSAQAVDRVQGGVIKNAGKLEATGLSQRGGRIVLDASDSIENTGIINAGATATGPAGNIVLTAPEITHSGSIAASGNAENASGGSLLIAAGNFSQRAEGQIDLSAPQQGGALHIETTGNVQLRGRVDVSATHDNMPAPTKSQGGQIDIQAQGDIEVIDATLDASGGQGGQIHLRAAAPADTAYTADSQPDNSPNPLPDAPVRGHLAIIGQSTLSTRGRSGNGGTTLLLGDHIVLLHDTTIDATGAHGGGVVLVGGDWQGSNGIYQARTVAMAQGASIDASAIDSGDGGKVVLWSDIHDPDSLTSAQGSITAKGGGGMGAMAERLKPRATPCNSQAPR